MTTELQEYYNMLYKISTENPPVAAILTPRQEPIHEIDLNTREISAPQYLGVKDDHRAETIYFKMSRYFDNVDLAGTSCIIEYKNANGDVHIYIPPFYDTQTLSYGGTPNQYSEMIIPWLLEGPVLAAAGKVTFGLKFFKTDAHYQPITLIKEDFIPNHYFIYDEESGTHVLATGFDSSKEYYLYEEGTGNSIKQEVTEDNYQADYYYVKNSDGELESDNGFIEGKNYYELVARVTYRLNTQLATSEVLQSSGFEEKYQIVALDELTYVSGYFYTKNSNGVYTICNDELYNPYKTYYEFSIPEVSLDNSLVAKTTTILNRMESLEDKLDLYWEVL